MIYYRVEEPVAVRGILHVPFTCLSLPVSLVRTVGMGGIIVNTLVIDSVMDGLPGKVLCGKLNAARALCNAVIVRMKAALVFLADSGAAFIR